MVEDPTEFMSRNPLHPHHMMRKSSAIPCVLFISPMTLSLNNYMVNLYPIYSNYMCYLSSYTVNLFLFLIYTCYFIRCMVNSPHFSVDQGHWESKEIIGTSDLFPIVRALVFCRIVSMTASPCRIICSLLLHMQGKSLNNMMQYSLYVQMVCMYVHIWLLQKVWFYNCNLE